MVLTRLWPAVFFLALLLSACSGSGSPSENGEASPTAAAAAGRRVPGGDTLLLAEGPRLSRIDAAGESELFELDGGAFILDPAAGGGFLAFAIQPPAVTRADGSLDFGSDLYVAPRDGGQLRLLVKHGVSGEFVRSPAWLPDGRRLLFDVRTPGANGEVDLRIEVIDLTSGARQRFLDDALSPVVSPDGKTIAVLAIDPATGQEDVVVVDLATRQAQPLLGRSSSKLLISSIAWSPDGSKILFAAADPLVMAGSVPGRGSTSHPTLRDIWIINRDGSNLHRLVDLAAGQPSAVWSSNGADVYVLGEQGLLSIGATSGQETPLGPGSEGGQIALLPRP